MKEYILSNGVKIPSIGYGTLNIPKGKETIKSVLKAIEVGYRHIDTAEVYENTSDVGFAINHSDLKREELFITSKLTNDNRGYDNAIKSFERTLEMLKLDYLDLYLIHWPLARGLKEEYDKVNLDTWRALEYLYNRGKVKAIGVSNFLGHHIDVLLKNAEIKPMVNQLEIHPGQPQNEIVKLCEKNNILVEAWGPLASGKIMTNDELQNIAKKYNKNVAQIAIKWCMQRDILPLPKSTIEERMRQNLNVFDFELSVQDMNYINKMKYFGGSDLNPDTVPF